MSRKVNVKWVDDSDGKSLADERLKFALDGVHYEIDLSAKHAKRLRDQLRPWIKAGRRVGGRKRRYSGFGGGYLEPLDREQHAVIREWAIRNGYGVGRRGRIPRTVVAAFQESA
ncbi:Lsr2 family protein [Mycobacterium sp.]|jgi:hypothetical protein|uniref:histone-like nucleoid-structuring protein Lsr2 n=1 Tax=Mycobacterium sp. TaxID=1785 RepID=UPI002D4D8B5F|nr:Lsr2 family protein [Mycobacterium sp.]HZA10344.1 Lsr2 family protein [Mycobacterium sp.]